MTPVFQQEIQELNELLFALRDYCNYLDEKDKELDSSDLWPSVKDLEEELIKIDETFKQFIEKLDDATENFENMVTLRKVEIGNPNDVEKISRSFKRAQIWIASINSLREKFSQRVEWKRMGYEHLVPFITFRARIYDCLKSKDHDN